MIGGKIIPIETYFLNAQGKTDRLQRKMHVSTVIGFNTPLSVIDRISRQKVSEVTVEQNSTINQLDLTDIYKTLHPKNSTIHIHLKLTRNSQQNRSPSEL